MTVPEAAVDLDMLTMYSTTWCGYCRRLKLQLDQAGLDYREVDIERDADAARERWTRLGSLVDLDDVARVLEEEGVGAFEKSFTEVLDSLGAKASDLRG